MYSTPMSHPPTTTPAAPIKGFNDSRSYRSMQEWLESRRDGRPVDISASMNWTTSSGQRDPPATALFDAREPAGARHAKGFPASMFKAQNNPIRPRGAPITAPPQSAAPAPSAGRRHVLSAGSAPPPPPAANLGAPMPGSGPATRSPMPIQKKLLREGQGKAACRGDVIDVAYVGWLTAVGDTSIFDRADEFCFRLGAGDVIAGWDFGAVGMREGEVARLIIPANLAYGPQGSPPVIPPNADLTFEIHLRGIISSGPQNTYRQSTTAAVHGMEPPQYPAQPSTAQQPGFTPTSRFAGPRDGEVFKAGDLGVGYYRDATGPTSRPPPAELEAMASEMLPPPPLTSSLKQRSDSPLGSINSLSSSLKTVRFGQGLEQSDSGLPPMATPDCRSAPLPASSAQKASQRPMAFSLKAAEISQRAPTSIYSQPTRVLAPINGLNGAIPGQGDFTRRSFMRL